MKTELNKEQEQAQTAFRNFVNEEIIPHADKYDREEHIPSDLIAKLARQGYPGATMPDKYGGRGMDMVTYGILNEELGRGCSSVRTLVMLQNMIARTVNKWGSERQKELWLDKIASGEVIAAFALTEPDVGSDAKSITTSITDNVDHYVINGTKKWISLGQIANLFLVFGRCERKLCAFLIEKDTPGLMVKPILGMSGLKASMLAELHFIDCKIPKENLVGGIGFGFFPVAIHALNIGRYSIAWGCVGIAQACLEACINFISNRKQFGVYLKDHQLIQQMITDMVANIKAARLLCLQAGHLEDRGDPKSVIEILVAKYFASTMATRVANNAVQIHGAAGCCSPHPVQRHLRDAKIMEIIEGTTQIHQIKIAEYALKEMIST